MIFCLLTRRLNNARQYKLYVLQSRGLHQMRTNPVENKFGKPIPKPITFGIYKQRIMTRYGYKDIGQFKDKIITIHHDNRDNTKMWYVTNSIGKWIKSKLVYFHNGIKKIIWSKSTNE